eukprot:g41753.t1
MIIPIRCFTCGKVVGNKWEQFLAILQAGNSVCDALNMVELQRYCCRRMVLTHVDLIDTLLKYNWQERRLESQEEKQQRARERNAQQ